MVKTMRIDTTQLWSVLCDYVHAYVGTYTRVCVHDCSLKVYRYIRIILIIKSVIGNT